MIKILVYLSYYNEVFRRESHHKGKIIYLYPGIRIDSHLVTSCSGVRARRDSIVDRVDRITA